MYSIVVGLGATLAVFWVVQNVPRWQASRWANAALLALLGALIGARLLYVIVQWEYFQSHVLEVLAIWEGGFSWVGALPGGLVAVALTSARWGIPFTRIADGLAPMVPPLVISGWLGAWMAGAAYGAPAPQRAFWGVPAIDEYGVTITRFPLQILAATVMLVYAFILERRKPVLRHDGLKAAWMAFGLGLDVLVFMPLRADPAPAWQGLSLHTWAAGLVFAAGACLLLWAVLAAREQAPAPGEPSEQGKA